MSCAFFLKERVDFVFKIPKICNRFLLKTILERGRV